jgi:hypothetical protein
MAKTSHPTETPATAWLKQHQVTFELRPYDYVDHGGTAESARGKRPKQKYLQGYWDEMQGIVETLIALERRMTIDAGRDPEDPKDRRKLTNHRGRAR